MEPSQRINPEKVIYEARARITWGDPPDEVREWLVSQGLSSMRIDELLHACMADRAAAVRRRAIAEILIGSVVLLLAVGGALLEIRSTSGNPYRGRGFGACVFLGFYGIYRLCRGLGWMASGPNVRGDVSKLGGWFY